MPPPRLTLLPINAEMLPLLDGGGAAFEHHYGVRIGESAELLRETVRQTIDFVTSVPREVQWGGFLVVDADLGAVVGMCGYKGGPSAAGEIEIAYGTLPSFEDRGYATAMADELTRRAFADGSARTVIAHTLPERNASCRVLEKNGFRRTGEVVDPEDGPVWRWERVQ